MKPFAALLEQDFPDKLRTNEPLARHCNWRVGGPADFLVIAENKSELKRAVTLACQSNVPFTILGYGANVLVSDNGIRGLVILNRATGIMYEAGEVIRADSGTNLAVLAKETVRNGIGNLEFLIGIPGTVGAAVAVNAGTRTEWISHILLDALVLNADMQEEWLSATKLGFAYRTSHLKSRGDVVLAARLRGMRCTPEEGEKKLKSYLTARKNQPSGPSAGSVFTNPKNDFAGRLIEACGLKGRIEGGAEISPRHANFIINKGDATAQNIKALIELAKTEVLRAYDIQLTEEIRYLGQW